MLNIKHGDRYDLSWVVREDDGTPLDLAGATVRLLAKDRSGVSLLPTTVTDAAGGAFTHTLDGTLDVGTYEVEVEISRGAEVRTAPTTGFETLRVAADLG